MIRPVAALAVSACLWAVPAAGQAPLTLDQAVARAVEQNHEARIAASAEQEASHRVVQARAGYLPRADVTETWQRGNQPVFVFGSLLAQRRFTAADFALDSLNRPDAIDNFRAGAGVEQTIYDGGATRARVRAAQLGVDLASAGRTRVAQGLAVATTHAYGQALLADASRRTADVALEAADADLERTRNRRDAGLVTDADVLAVEVHRAAVEEARIRSDAAARIAHAQLNLLMGVPLDDTYTLAMPVQQDARVPVHAAALEAEALTRRPEVAEAALRVQLADADRDSARAAWLPQVVAHAGWESNGHRWNERSGSWLAGTSVRLNVFKGLADRARLAEVVEATRRRALERDQVESAIRLEVRTAVAELDAAHARAAVAARVVAQAEESRRIVRDRYEQGLADVASLLRAAEATVQAQEQQIRAHVDVLVESAGLERVLGR